MEMKGKKVRATFQFGLDKQPDSFTPRHDGVLQLFEHRCPVGRTEQVTFWDGVATISEDRHVRQFVDETASKEALFVRVEFEDKRKAIATYMGGDLAKEYFTLALSGYSSLAPIPALTLAPPNPP